MQCCTSGLDEARASGVTESKRDSIPVAGDNNGGQQQQVTNNNNNNQETQKTGASSFWDAEVGDGEGYVAGWDEMSPEQQAHLINSLKHGGVH